MSVIIPKVLIAGWFSFESPYNTAGDLLARQVLVRWLLQAGYDYDIALPLAKQGKEVDVESVDPTRYIAIIFVCGPVTSGHVTPLMRKFRAIKRIAVNVSVVPTSDLSVEFDEIIARDSPLEVNPDIVLLSEKNYVPVIGLIYAGRQKEYPNQRHDRVQAIVSKVLGSQDIAVVGIDTKLPYNEFGLKSIGQIESTIRRMDAVITTRLHGTVLSLRNDVPVIAIDPVPGGAKVARQARVLSWPVSCSADELTEQWLAEALAKVLKTDMSSEIHASVTRGSEHLSKVEERLLNALERGY